MQKKSIFFKILTRSAPLRACETRSQCVSLAPSRAPLKLSLLHSIVFHMLLIIFSMYNVQKNFTNRGIKKR